MKRLILAFDRYRLKRLGVKAAAVSLGDLRGQKQLLGYLRSIVKITDRHWATMPDSLSCMTYETNFSSVRQLEKRIKDIFSRYPFYNTIDPVESKHRPFKDWWVLPIECVERAGDIGSPDPIDANKLITSDMSVFTIALDPTLIDGITDTLIDRTGNAMNWNLHVLSAQQDIRLLCWLLAQQELN